MYRKKESDPGAAPIFQTSAIKTFVTSLKSYQLQTLTALPKPGQQQATHRLTTQCKQRSLTFTRALNECCPNLFCKSRVRQVRVQSCAIWQLSPGFFFIILILQMRLVWQTAEARCPLDDILHHLFTSAPGMKNYHVSCSEEYF